MTLSAPTEYLIPCPRCLNDDVLRVGCVRCDSRGKIVSDEERRSATRMTGRDLYLEYVRFTNHANETIARLERELAHNERHIDALLTENRRYREAIHKAATTIVRDQSRLLDRAEPKGGERA